METWIAPLILLLPVHKVGGIWTIPLVRARHIQKTCMLWKCGHILQQYHIREHQWVDVKVGVGPDAWHGNTEYEIHWEPLQSAEKLNGLGKRLDLCATVFLLAIKIYREQLREVQKWLSSWPRVFSVGLVRSIWTPANILDYSLICRLQEQWEEIQEEMQ